MSGPRLEGAGQGCGPDPWEFARRRTIALLDRAERYRQWLAEVPERTAAALAKREGISRARVSQVLALVRLPVEVVADLRRSTRTGPVPTEKELCRLAAVADPWKATEAYHRLVQPEGRAPRRRGFAHDLERARHIQGMLDSGVVSSLTEVGRVVGLSGGRVGQIVALLQLAPEIVAAIDVAPERLPRSVTAKAIREIAGLRSHDAQRRLVAARWPALLETVSADRSSRHA